MTVSLPAPPLVPCPQTEKPRRANARTQPQPPSACSSSGACSWPTCRNSPPPPTASSPRGSACAASSPSCSWCSACTSPRTPSPHPERRPWSNSLYHFLQRILPHDPDFPRYASGIGLELISLALHLSPPARDVLANKYFIWLGKQSFSVYLLHGPMIRTFLVWMVYGISLPAATKNDKGEVVYPSSTLPAGLPLDDGAPLLDPHELLRGHVVDQLRRPHVREVDREAGRLRHREEREGPTTSLKSAGGKREMSGPPLKRGTSSGDLQKSPSLPLPSRVESG